MVWHLVVGVLVAVLVGITLGTITGAILLCVVFHLNKRWEAWWFLSLFTVWIIIRWISALILPKTWYRNDHRCDYWCCAFTSCTAGVVA